MPYRIEATRSWPGPIVSGAVAVSPAPVAVTVALPPFGPAVKVVVAAVRGRKDPSPGGSSVQVTETAWTFPYWSTPTAPRVVGSPAGTGAGLGGLIRSESGGPGRIVSACVPLDTPAAAAVIVLLPAAVSR